MHRPTTRTKCIFRTVCWHSMTQVECLIWLCLIKPCHKSLLSPHKSLESTGIPHVAVIVCPYYIGTNYAGRSNVTVGHAVWTTMQNFKERNGEGKERSTRNWTFGIWNLEHSEFGIRNERDWRWETCVSLCLWRADVLCFHMKGKVMSPWRYSSHCPHFKSLEIYV